MDGDEKVKKVKKQMYRWTYRYASRVGYKLNPDDEMLDLVLEGLAKNKIKHGRRYCPCRIITGDEEQDKKVICPCVYHKDEIDNDGMCHCALFFYDGFE
ncbi:ferredoxin-thioredoxin reductase catalytic domain-containing protein [Methanohalobium sp.]|uniref:ferredoxin-thioredoxin reductase catalytic domain-containing protein n=1 Tax=Methanohalobium sp. TaxID=2837493 RepID=UPI0025FC841D|nr:ferredoxin-thioredoxin reductase catalytic domain-containing protein [Methanohalobium sp.]